MAKFLTFVVEKSTPLYIYQTLIQRSKGMNNLLVTSIFYLVVDKGIDSVRKTAEDMPDMALSKIYEELLTKHPNNRISNDFFQKMQGIGYLVKQHCWGGIPEELQEYDLEDIMSFMLVMALIGNLKDFTTIPFQKMINGDEFKAETNLIKSKLFE